jgi:hypothetical protein
LVVWSQEIESVARARRSCLVEGNTPVMMLSVMLIAPIVTGFVLVGVGARVARRQSHTLTHRDLGRLRES